MTYQSFEEMPVWKKAMDLAQRTYDITDSLPRKEDYGLTSQLRRAALSVSGNISEGFGRKHTKDKLNFYYASRGSLAETRNHLIYGRRVGYFRNGECREALEIINDVWKELNALIRTLQKMSQT